MRRGARFWLIGCSLLLLAAAARSGELGESIPGTPLTDVEMSQLRGKGLSVVCGGDGDFSTCFSDTDVALNDASTNSSVNTIDESFGFADGILTVTQFTGNGNRVDVFIQLEVNLNRVSVGNDNTAVTVTQSLDFGNLTGSLQNLKFDN